MSVNCHLCGECITSENTIGHEAYDATFRCASCGESTCIKCVDTKCSCCTTFACKKCYNDFYSVTDRRLKFLFKCEKCNEWVCIDHNEWLDERLCWDCEDSINK